MALKYVSLFKRQQNAYELEWCPILDLRCLSGEARLEPLLRTLAFFEAFCRGCGWVWAGPELSDGLASTHSFVFSCTTVVIVKKIISDGSA